MIKNECCQSSITGNGQWSEPNLTYNVGLKRVNYVYINPELVRLIRNKERRTHKRKKFLYHYLYFCSTISYLSHVDKRFKGEEYVNINYEVLISVISEYKYTEIINNLLDWRVISIDNSYSVSRKSKGYKLNAPYNMNLKKFIIKDELINKKLNTYKEKQLSELKQLPYPYQYLEMTNKWIKMNIKQAENYNKMMYLNETNMTVYDSNYYSISAYDIDDYRFVVDTFGNRAHTNITNLKSDLRPFLEVQGDKLGQVDITNSQPAFFYLLIKDDCRIPPSEKMKYKDLIERGRFYEFFLEKLSLPESDRNKFKEKIITSIFYDRYREKESRYIKVFREDFPFITNYINEMKKIDNANLAALLQKLESKLIIETVVGEFINRYEGQFISTIHDSIVVKIDQLPMAETIMKECFENLGFKPKVSISVFK